MQTGMVFHAGFAFLGRNYPVNDLKVPAWIDSMGDERLVYMATEKKKCSLTPVQRMAAEMLGSGMKRKDVAQHVKVHEETITKWKRVPAFREMVGLAAEAFIEDMRLKALDVFAQHLEDGDKRIAQQAAGQVLKLAEGLMDKEQDRQVTVTFANMPKPGEVMEDHNA